jgi:hypothetical protein
MLTSTATGSELINFMALRANTVALECCLYVRNGILERNASVGITLRYALGKNLCDPQQLLLARLPHAYQHCAGGDSATFPGSDLGSLSEVFFDSLEQRVHVFPDIFGIIFLDDLLQSRSAVATVARNFRRCGCLQLLFDAIKVILRIVRTLIYLVG